jgi:hypothetical protein|tara:strand:- start:2307 stop:3236 length:930 start_codon:yes stop_codon:yes gene_type:complete
MEERDGDVIMTDVQWQRLWQKSALGQRIDGGGLRFLSEEVMFAHVHRHQELPSEDWITNAINDDPDLLDRYIILESLRAPGNIIVLLNHKNIESWNYSESSWALRWHGSNHPDNDPPIAEIRWHRALDSIDINELFSWSVSVSDRGRIPEIIVIDDEGSVVTYVISSCNPTGNVDNEKTGIIGVQTPWARRYSDVELQLIGDEENDDLAIVLNDLHKRGLQIRSGFKFGTRWRAYEDEIGTDHAQWLIDPNNDAPKDWTAACLNARLAAGVKKRYIVSLINKSSDEYTIKYLEFIRPDAGHRWVNLEKY